MGGIIYYTPGSAFLSYSLFCGFFCIVPRSWTKSLCTVRVMRSGINISSYLETKSLKNPINNLTNQALLQFLTLRQDTIKMFKFSPDLVLNTVQAEAAVFGKSPYKESLHHRWPRQK